MITREDIRNFLIGQKGKTKEEVVSNFASWVIVQGIDIGKLAKMIADLRSYPEWTWGE